MDLQYIFLNGDGRIHRQDFWIGLVILIVANVVGGFVAGLIGWIIAGVVGGAILSGLVGLALVVPAYFLLIKRSNDRCHPQTYVQALVAISLAYQLKNMVIPVQLDSISLLSVLFTLAVGLAGLWALIDLGFMRGTVGPNTYGPDPLEAPAR
ncbi:DUF805 domain-containing protein [Phreatobacter sp.]|uniref:DUF805 domain-containing protein n=1 Tax=Phreatobacter sp. TaxID=1966341 RepID=UPI003F718FBF